MKITTLIENHENKGKHLIGEHGLSLLIEADGKRILFDTGQTDAFLENAKKLKVDVRNVQTVVLSHGHYDHTGGMKALLRTGYQGDILVGKGFFNPKYKKLPDGNWKYNGISLTQEDTTANIIDEPCYKISENLMIFRGFEKRNDFEKPNPHFFIKREEEFVLDEFGDEICLGIKTQKGIILVAGCSHVGIINMVQTVKKETGIKIRGIIGGTHLVEADERRLNETVEALKKEQLEFLAVSHCTGEQHMERLRREFGSRFIENITGNIMEFDT